MQETQQRYEAIVPHSYVQSGVEQMTSNMHSATSFGVSPTDPRTGSFQGNRYLLSSNVGRSQQTAQAEPVFDNTPGASQSASQSQSLQGAQYGQQGK